MKRLLPLIAAILLATACTSEESLLPPDGGEAGRMPVRIATCLMEPEGDSSPQTRAQEAFAPADGTTLRVYMHYSSGGTVVTEQADYTYSAATAAWAPSATGGLYWPDATTACIFTAISPASLAPADATYDGLSAFPLSLPTDWTAAELARYEDFAVTAATSSTVAPTTAGITLALYRPLVKVEIYADAPSLDLLDAPATGIVNPAFDPATGTAATTDGTAAAYIGFHTESNFIHRAFLLPDAAATTLTYMTDNKAYDIDLTTTPLTAGSRLTTSAPELTGNVVTCGSGQSLADWLRSQTTLPNPLCIVGTVTDDDLLALDRRSGTDGIDLYLLADGVTEYKYGGDLRSIYAPNITTVDQAFQGCTSLVSVNLPNATEIGIASFQNCQSLTSVNLPNVTEIGNGSFPFCSSLTSINLPKVTRIGEGTFQMCGQLTTVSIGIHNGELPTCGNGAFSPCPQLTTLLLQNVSDAAAIPTGVTSWGGITWTTIKYGLREGGDPLNADDYQYTYNNP